jgi:hypothetical protein
MDDCETPDDEITKTQQPDPKLLEAARSERRLKRATSIPREEPNE